AARSCAVSIRAKPSSSRATGCRSVSSHPCAVTALSAQTRRLRCSATRLAWTPPATAPISTRSSPRTSNLVPEDRHPRGLLDTSVIIELDQLEPHVLPLEVAVSALTMAELAAG